MQKAVHDTFANRHRSDTDWQAWEQACVRFHQQYGELAYPTDAGSLSAFRRGEFEGIEIECSSISTAVE